MPKMSLQYVLDHADELAGRFEAMTIDADDLHPVAPLKALAEAAQRRTAAEQDMAAQVTACRAAGWPWADIGRVLGVTAQAAQQKYGKLAADADDDRR